MKTRKILALVMAIAIFALSMTVVASAEESERPTSVYKIQNKPNLTYTDADCFNPAGLSISDGSTTVYYDTDSQFFTFSVAENQPLTVYITEIEVFYKGESCGFLENVKVSHLGSASGEIIYINNHHHGQICDVCGVTCKNESHEEYVDYWVPNGDASLLINETESGYCEKCGTRVSRYIEGTATYVTAFAEVDILVTILGLVSSIVQAFTLL